MLGVKKFVKQIMIILVIGVLSFNLLFAAVKSISDGMLDFEVKYEGDEIKEVRYSYGSYDLYSNFEEKKDEFSFGSFSIERDGSNIYFSYGSLNFEKKGEKFYISYGSFEIKKESDDNIRFRYGSLEANLKNEKIYFSYGSKRYIYDLKTKKLLQDF